MTHWRVRRETTYYFDPDGNDAFGLRWCVYSPSGLYWGNYKNHAEALARADRQARTIEVTLPRGVSRVGLGPNAWLELRVDGGASVHGGCGSVGIRQYAMKRAALAMLAVVNHVEGGNNV